MLALPCAGCSDRPHRQAQNLTSRNAHARSTDQESVTSTADSLRVSLLIPGEVPAGRPVPIVIRLENTGAGPRDLYLRGRTIAFDIFITRPNGQAVWQRLKDEVIPAIVQLKALSPGEVLELEHHWDQRGNHGEPVAPGAYMVRGAILTEGSPRLETAIASLRIQSN